MTIITVNADIDVEDTLNEIGTEDLVAYLSENGNLEDILLKLSKEDISDAFIEKIGIDVGGQLKEIENLLKKENIKEKYIFTTLEELIREFE